jgi:hypothetical protein
MVLTDNELQNKTNHLGLKKNPSGAEKMKSTLARTFHKHARALACSLIPQGIILNRPDQ